MNPQPIRLLIVDDHELVRKGLRSFLDLEADLRVVGEAETAAQAVELVERLHPRLVLLDVRLPDASGIDTCRRLLAVSPEVRILVLTSYAEDNTVVAAVQNGAHGYALKDVKSDDLIRAIHIVAEGRGYLDPRIAQQALQWIRTRPPSTPAPRGLAQLSPQERLIMPLLADGKTNKEIALQLRLSDKTVKNYLANIFDKLQVKRRTEAVAWFLRETQSFSPSRHP
ncbi:response regulator [Nitrospira moscoviensis]|uniref:Transcriptional regulatory protein DevR (DosR) n=1 Tax=Nitrospira moscoviensis TaxID=42253 RepID=A0A0K2G7Q0_NITMO|nr:response regulator transcription factor [Nitrospira moscoviensis]ALA56950.1 Transcriptional regulatory protein DevR (DosR) [Nitrospira moscoviensis]